MKELVIGNEHDPVRAEAYLRVLENHAMTGPEIIIEPPEKG